MLPEGWTVEVTATQWTIGTLDIARGTVPEAMFIWMDLIDTSRLISLGVDLMEFEEITLRFKHMYDHFAGEGPAVGVASRSGGGDWTSIWEIDSMANAGPQEINLTILNCNVRQADF